MNKATSVLLAAVLVSASTLATAEVVSVERYQVEVTPSDYVPYSGAFAQRFPGGFGPGLGSGLAFVGRTSAGALQFLALTDRGPNGDAPKVVAGDGSKSASKIFPSPDFVPTWMLVTVQDGKAVASERVYIHDSQGPITGLPLAKGLIGSTNEVALDDQLNTIRVNLRNGMDSEGIVSDGKGGFWICDEYGPFIAHLDSSGKILKKYGPQPLAGEESVAGGLPNIVKWRQPNRGFEGIARTPNGKIYAAVQSTLNIEGETKNSAQFIRLVELDPATGKTRMLAYPHDVSAYKRSKDAKIGDLVAVDDNSLLIVEQGKGKGKKMRNLVYRIDLSGATDLSGKEINGRALEYADRDALAAAGVRMLSKSLLVDLRKHGWEAEKAEGLVIVDERTIGLASDNDFGMDVKIIDPVDGVKKAKKYTTDGQGSLSFKGKSVDSRLEIEALQGVEANSQLWVMTFDKARF